MRPFNNYSGYHINASYGKTETTANFVRLDEFLAQTNNSRIACVTGVQTGRRGKNE